VAKEKIHFMKKVNHSFTKGFNAVLVALLTVLGFGACNSNSDYTLTGKVVDKTTKQPIKGIRVGYSQKFRIELMYGVTPTDYKERPFALTDKNGNYVLLTSEKDSVLFIEDIDEYKNGGYYYQEKIRVELKEGDVVTQNVELEKYE
jgi:putative lipoprotein (rSAM/lipoprotein system)